MWLSFHEQHGMQISKVRTLPFNSVSFTSRPTEATLMTQSTCDLRLHPVITCEHNIQIHEVSSPTWSIPPCPVDNPGLRLGVKNTLKVN